MLTNHGNALLLIARDPNIRLRDIAVLAQLRGIGLQRLVDSPAIDTERLRQTVTGYWHRALALPQPPA